MQPRGRDMSVKAMLRILAGLALSSAFTAATPSPCAAKSPGLHVTSRIPGPDGGWDLATFDPARRRVYVAHGASVMEIDADTGKTNPTFAAGERLHGVVVIP